MHSPTTYWFTAYLWRKPLA